VSASEVGGVWRFEGGAEEGEDLGAERVARVLEAEDQGRGA
jgi:hypothetical protein